MKRIIFYASIAFFSLSACTKETIVDEFDGSLDLSMDARVGTEDFSLDKNFTLQNRTYNFTQFRYWVSNLTLVKADGGEVKIPNSYFLIEETSPVEVQDGAFTYPATKRETISLKGIPMGDYKAIKFSIGVDPKYNDNLSLQAGELSQLNGMTNVSWMWHTTYIFSSLKGKVTEGSTTKDMLVETGLNANYKSVSINLPSTIRISSKKASAVELAVSVDKIFDGVDLIATPSIGAGQATQMQQVATNFGTKVFAAKSAQ